MGLELYIRKVSASSCLQTRFTFPSNYNVSFKKKPKGKENIIYTFVKKSTFYLTYWTHPSLSMNEMKGYFSSTYLLAHSLLCITLILKVFIYFIKSNQIRFPNEKYTFHPSLKEITRGNYALFKSHKLWLPHLSNRPVDFTHWSCCRFHRLINYAW